MEKILGVTYDASKHKTAVSRDSYNTPIATAPLKVISCYDHHLKVSISLRKKHLYQKYAHVSLLGASRASSGLEP